MPVAGVASHIIDIPFKKIVCTDMLCAGPQRKLMAMIGVMFVLGERKDIFK